MSYLRLTLNKKEFLVITTKSGEVIKIEFINKQKSLEGRIAIIADESTKIDRVKKEIADEQ